MENRHRIATTGARVKSSKEGAKGGTTLTLYGTINTKNTRACDCKARFYLLQNAYDKLQKEKETRYNALREMYDLRSEELDKLQHLYKNVKEQNHVLKEHNATIVHASSELLVVANWLLEQNEEITVVDNTLIRKACERLEQTLGIVS
ncbi:uncharacterized protein LOC126571467 [Anopheles aquasalis]|uniref:uncharacterized protein LOC126571467 n=1 Tax=Anopheles aquasalis TaxID=42839 RepID=UPI00215AE44B|nr:uncharacterized protein LOC126571467 [Anopheles aquasalis]